MRTIFILVLSLVAIGCASNQPQQGQEQTADKINSELQAQVNVYLNPNGDGPASEKMAESVDVSGSNITVDSSVQGSSEQSAKGATAGSAEADGQVDAPISVTPGP